MLLYSYFEIIKTPMDLSTMNAKLEAGMYKDRFGFESDFKIMTGNCKQYNVVGSYAHNEAMTLQSFFDKRECLAVNSYVTALRSFIRFRMVQD